MSFAAQVRKSRGDTVYQVIAPSPDGRTAWYFVRVEPSKVRRFLQEAGSDTPTDFEEFGEILESGWGEEPPENIIAEMVSLYGYNP